MLSFVFGAIKLACLTILILVASHLVRFQNRSVSDHVGRTVHRVASLFGEGSVGVSLSEPLKELRKSMPEEAYELTTSSSATKRSGSAARKAQAQETDSQDREALRTLIKKGD